MVYCYIREDGKRIEREYPFGKAPPTVRLKDGTYRRDYQAESAHGQVRNATAARQGRGHGRWPMEPCFASGVHPSQAQELRDYLGARGCPTEVTKDGDPIYTSQRHQDKALKLRGFYNRSSYT